MSFFCWTTSADWSRALVLGRRKLVLAKTFQSIEKQHAMKQLTMFELLLLVVQFSSSSYFNKCHG